LSRSAVARAAGVSVVGVASRSSTRPPTLSCGAWVERHRSIAAPAAERLVERADQLGRRGGVDVAGGVVLDLIAVEGDDVAAKGNVIVGELDAHRGGLEHGASLHRADGVVAEHREVGDVGAERPAWFDRAKKADPTGAGDSVDVRFLRDLQRSLAAEANNWAVGHAIAQDDDRLHEPYSLRKCSLNAA
jgi:hypothetical protein